jgi:hypothetical protein
MESILNSSVAGNPLAFTWFNSHDAPAGQRLEMSWSDLCHWIATASPTSPTKDGLPLIKMATFTGNYRSDANAEAVHAVEGDYDGERVQPDKAAAVLQDAGIEAFICTMPSHRPDAPRWRVLAPLSRSIPPEDRHALVARLNGALGGILAAESFTLSQAFYVGALVDGEPLQSWRVAGRPIDTVEGVVPLGPPAPQPGSRIAPGRGARAPSYGVALAALQYVTPDADRNAWLKLSGAFFMATDGLSPDEQRLADWQAWCVDYGETNNPADNAKTWAGFAKSGTTGDFKTLADMTREPIAMAWRWFKGVQPPPPRNIPRPHAANDSGTFFRRVCEIVPRDPVFLVDGLIEEDSTTVVFGEPGTGKSLVAIDLSASIATGTQFHGRHVLSGAVFYIAGEGMSGLRRRFAAWEAVQGVSLDGAALFQSRSAVQMLDGSSAAMLIDAVEAMAIAHGMPRLIVIDTLARNFGPGDENSTADMNRFVAALDQLRERFAGSSVLVVHHSGHGEKGRARGSSVLRAAADAEYMVSRVDDALHLTCSKMKEAAPQPVQAFEIRPAAGSVALEFAGEPTAKVKPKKMNTMAMESLTAAMVDGRADRETWRSEFYSRHDGSPDAKKTAFGRAVKDLLESGAVRTDDQMTFTHPPMPGAPNR